LAAIGNHIFKPWIHTCSYLTYLTFYITHQNHKYWYNQPSYEVSREIKLF
jgi:hypothetical protein